MVTDNDSADSTPNTSIHIENRLLNCIGLKQAEELIGKCHSNPMNYKVGKLEGAQDKVVFQVCIDLLTKVMEVRQKVTKAEPLKSSIQDAISCPLERNRVDLPG
jgi:hypothetical protein